MKTYQITIRKQGIIQQVIEGITAQAIEQVEKNYNSGTFQLSDKNGQVKNFSWSGLEFEARELGMVLS